MAVVSHFLRLSCRRQHALAHRGWLRWVAIVAAVGLLESVGGCDSVHLARLAVDGRIAYATGHIPIPELEKQCAFAKAHFGINHRNTIRCYANLGWFVAQYGASTQEQLAPELTNVLLAARGSSEFGDTHPTTLRIQQSLGLLDMHVGNTDEGIHLIEAAVLKARAHLGPNDPLLNTMLHNLAFAYMNIGLLSMAEPLLEEAGALCTRTRAEGCDKMRFQLGILYARQGKYVKAEELLDEAMVSIAARYKATSPEVMFASIYHAMNLAALGKDGQAMRELRNIQEPALSFLSAELSRREGGRAKREFLRAPIFVEMYNLVVSLASRDSSPLETREMAANLMLRWRQILGEEEAYVRRLASASADSRIRAAALDVSNLRAVYASAVLRRGIPEMEAAPLAAALLAKESELSRLSREFSDHVQVQSAHIDAVRAALPPFSALLEIRQYRRFTRPKEKQGVSDSDDARWVAMVQKARSNDVQIVDLGSVAQSKVAIDHLRGASPKEAERAAATLYAKLFGGVDSILATFERIYVSLDGELATIPLGRLRLPDGRYWEERQELRLVQTGRDLVRQLPTSRTSGLLALGGIDFNASRRQSAAGRGSEDLRRIPQNGHAIERAVSVTRDMLRSNFRFLPASYDEADQVKRFYEAYWNGEKGNVWSGDTASEGRLKALAFPPRVLHLATHAFYLKDRADVEEPMLLSGVALAGANRALAGGRPDGILTAWEVPSINLTGTELVVLSACETGLGRVDYSEGVYGLVRAFRIAGSRQVMATLWPVRDSDSRDFMISFYSTWKDGDPASALRQTRLNYIKGRKDPRLWAPYVMYGGV